MNGEGFKDRLLARQVARRSGGGGPASPGRDATTDQKHLDVDGSEPLGVEDSGQ